MVKRAVGSIIEIKDIPGIGETALKKLSSVGIVTLAQIANSNPRRLQEIEGIGEETAFKLITASREALGLGDFMDGLEIARDEEKICRITTGSKELDNLLLSPSLQGKERGGVESMLITEAFGKFSSGKSQIGFELAINVQLPKEEGGLDGAAIYFDSENTFRSTRIKEICVARGLDPEKILPNIYVSRVVSTDHLQNLLIKAEEYVRDKNVRLIVVDSIIAPFRREYRGREELPKRQGALNDVLTSLQNISNIYNIPIYVTNQVMDNPDGFLFSDPTLPVGGNILAHATCRLYLMRKKDNRRLAKLVDSSCLPQGEALFQITNKGIEDVE